MDIPLRMQYRPKYGGLPIPFTQFIGPDGKPDFRVLDDKKRMQAIHERLCAICGKRLMLDPQMAFIGGDLCAKNRMFNDPAMHPECARYSAATCPHLRREIPMRPVKPGENLVEVDIASSTRAKRHGIFISKGYHIVRVGAAILIRSDEFLSIEWIQHEQR